MYDLHRGIMYSSSFQSSFPLPYSLLAEPTRFLFRRWAHKILFIKTHDLLSSYPLLLFPI